MSKSALGAHTAVEAGAAAGESGSIAYNLGVKQTYDPWLSNELLEITPTAYLGGHVWDRSNDTVWGATLAPGLVLSMFTTSDITPYLAGSLGGTVISDSNFGPRDLDSNLLFMTKGAAGVQFGESRQHRIQGEYTNYSTWGLTSNDDGYSTVGLSYGYSF